MSSNSPTSKRLLLRQWRDEDRPLFASLNRDPEVMEFFPRPYTQEESNSFIDLNAERIERQGWGCWAVESLASGEFIGFVGFARPAEWHPCAGEVEIGWRLAHEHWGKGYATEAAVCALEFGFNSIGFDELVSFTSECNLRSINVMQKIGMHRDGLGFDHPRIDKSSKLITHVVFRLTSQQFGDDAVPAKLML